MAIMYGPVPGSGVTPASFCGEAFGTMEACCTASLSKNSESGAVRWNVTVPACASATTPGNAQPAGVFRHRSAPTMPL